MSKTQENNILLDTLASGVFDILSNIKIRSYKLGNCVPPIRIKLEKSMYDEEHKLFNLQISIFNTSELVIEDLSISCWRRGERYFLLNRAISLIPNEAKSKQISLSKWICDGVELPFAVKYIIGNICYEQSFYFCGDNNFTWNDIIDIDAMGKLKPRRRYRVKKY